MARPCPNAMSDETAQNRRSEARPARRLIDAAEWSYERFNWTASVRRDHDLGVLARLVADCLALDFANARTLRCDPSYRQIAQVLGKSTDTVKRAIRELVDAGWLVRRCGDGRGHSGDYGFLTDANVVRLKGGKNAPPEGGRDAPLSGSQRGADLHGKGGKSASGHNIAKPWKNHGARGGPHAHAPARAREASAPKLSQNPLVIRDAERAVEALREGREAAIFDLKPWVRDHVIAAGLLTEAERARLGLAISENEGKTDDR